MQTKRSPGVCARSIHHSLHGSVAGCKPLVLKRGPEGLLHALTPPALHLVLLQRALWSNEMCKSRVRHIPPDLGLTLFCSKSWHARLQITAFPTTTSIFRRYREAEGAGAAQRCWQSLQMVVPSCASGKKPLQGLTEAPWHQGGVACSY